ncbi:MurR/RpiR family transcriptional regulator [Oceanobacillus chungangensis]|uniref:MurR/RpiR family transcriptional regulator n=1 Tax=Oceanobacillus chungangensis TaxID=1229152 RepID=A0A3D8PI02_9BACI|nr:MurR/RpiR family transcriptional regulator [Oceanobacillus chungangensis]
MDLKWDTKAMSPNQYKLADYIQKNFNHVLLSTEQEISDALKISIATVSRFWRTVGYKNFKDFKATMRRQLDVSPAGKMENIMNSVAGQEIEHHNLYVSINHLQKTIEHFSDHSFNVAVEMLTTAKQIYIHSPGPSEGLGALMTYRLSRFGLSLQSFEKGGSEILEDLLHLTKDDVVVLFAFVRILPEAKVILEHAKQIGFQTIIITDQLVSNFANYGDIVLFASRGEMWEFHSMVAPTFLIENLIITIGMKNKDANLQRLEQLSGLRKRYAEELPR